MAVVVSSWSFGRKRLVGSIGGHVDNNCNNALLPARVIVGWRSEQVVQYRPSAFLVARSTWYCTSS